MKYVFEHISVKLGEVVEIDYRDLVVWTDYVGETQRVHMIVRRMEPRIEPGGP